MASSWCSFVGAQHPGRRGWRVKEWKKLNRKRVCMFGLRAVESVSDGSTLVCALVMKGSWLTCVSGIQESSRRGTEQAKAAMAGRLVKTI